MAQVKITETTLTNIGKAIRQKTGGSGLLLPGEMPSAILAITSPGGTSDATLNSGDKMLKGYTAYAKGIKYSGTIPTYIGQVDGTQGHVGSYTTYSGSYNLTPSIVSQVLSTSNCVLLSDIHIASYPSQPASVSLTSLVAYSNGSYSVPAGYDGFSDVVVDVPTTETIEPTLSELEALSNGTYYASDTQVDGFSVVHVDVPQYSLESVTLYGNGTVQASSGYAFSQVTVDVPALSIGTLSVSSNGVYGIGQYDAYSEITVDVPTPSMSLLEVSSNGVFLPSELSTDGFSKVIVDVPQNSATFMHKIVSESGVYYASNDSVDGYSVFTVAVDGRPPVLSSLTVSVNGSYSPASGYDGFDNVVVDVPTPEPSVASKTISVNGTYNASDDDVVGYSQVVVSVPQNATLSSASFSSNGVYQASAAGVDGFSEVVVDIPEKELKTIIIYNDGEYNASDFSVNGWDKITVSVSAGYNYTYIASSAFKNISTLYVASFPMASIIYESAFYNCEGLQEASFPVCTVIGSGAFNMCSSMTDVYFPIVERLGNNAFANCSALSVISLPECTAASYAFKNCTSLVSVYMPKLSSCPTEIIDSSISPDGSTYTRLGCFGGAVRISELTVGFSYGYSDTFDSLGLKYLSMSLCTDVHPKMFKKFGRSVIETIYMPELSNHNGVIASCENLKSVTIGISSISSAVLSCKSTLQTVNLPSCATIKSYAFCSYEALQSLSFPQCIDIGEDAFKYCSALTSVSLPKCETIGSYAFAHCYDLETIVLPKTTQIGVGAFTAYDDSGLLSLYLPGSQYCSIVGGSTITWCAGYTDPYGRPVVRDGFRIYVPASMSATYKEMSCWSNYRYRFSSI